MGDSKIYILQCEKAVEIQEEHQPDCGDYFKLAQPDGKIVILSEHPRPCIEKITWLVRIAFPKCTGYNLDYKYIKDAIWLPRQDRLQEMIRGIAPMFDTWIVQLKHIYDFAFSCEPSKAPLSWEQLLLAFLYKEKYNKVWSGTDWVKDKVATS